MKRISGTFLAIAIFISSWAALISSTHAADCATGFRLFDDKFLATEPVCIPDKPQRIVIADFAAFDVMYSLNIKPVGYSSLLIFGWYSNMVPEMMPAIQTYLAEAEDVGGIPVNFESILATKPDLILLNGLLARDETVYKQFSAIAPTVVKNETNTDDWRNYIRFYAKVLNHTEDVEARLRSYDERQEQLRQDSSGMFAGKTISLVQVNDPATIYLNFPTYRGWLPLGELGFKASDAQLALVTAEKADDTPVVQLSTERIGLLNTDYVVLMNAAFDPETQGKNVALFDSYATDALWKQLPAVKNKRFYLVDLAWQANGLISAHAVLDDMYRLFLGRTPTTPNPYLSQLGATSGSSQATPTAEVTAIPTTTLPQIEGFAAFSPVPTMFDIIEDRGDTLLVRHLMGETVIPKQPQRVYTDASTTQIALSLGLPVVAAQYFTNLRDIPELGDLLKGVPDVGTNTYQANFEAILAARPDLIITWANVATNPARDAVYQSLSQIAPTIVLNGNPFSFWKQATLKLGTALGRVDKATTLLADYQQKSAALCDRIRAVIGNGTVTIFDVFGDEFRVITAAAATPDGSVVPLAFTSWAYLDCGLTPGAEVATLNKNSAFGNISLESLGELKADHLIAYVNVASPDAETTFDTFTKSPVWQLLPAVQQGQVYRVGVLDASGYYSALYVLEQVATAVTDRN
jgi:iron complex transport system substrate-binding protein